MFRFDVDACGCSALYGCLLLQCVRSVFAVLYNWLSDAGAQARNVRVLTVLLLIMIVNTTFQLTIGVLSGSLAVISDGSFNVCSPPAEWLAGVHSARFKCPFTLTARVACSSWLTGCVRSLRPFLGSPHFSDLYVVLLY